jgi:hypothetical protein
MRSTVGFSMHLASSGKKRGRKGQKMGENDGNWRNVRTAERSGAGRSCVADRKGGEFERKRGKTTQFEKGPMRLDEAWSFVRGQY